MAAKKKVAKKKAPAKKPVAKKTAVKKVAKKVTKKAAVAAPVIKPLKTQKDAMTKTQVLTTIAERTGLSRKEVGSVMDSLSEVIAVHMTKRGAGQFTLPGLLKIKTKKVPARKAKKNVPNPFKPGELMDVAARPASNKVKILPLKKLKEMV